MINVHAIDTLECISDGETIVPGMGFVLPDGIGTTQYYDPSTGAVTPSYSKSQAVVMWPKCYSSGSGQFVVPEKDGNGQGTWQWYLGNPESEGTALLANAGGAVKSSESRFEATTVTVTVGGAQREMPALKVVGNLASADQTTDVTVYCKFVYNGMTVTCHGTIGVRVTTGSVYEVVLECKGGDGTGDSVIDNENESITLTAQLQKNGERVTDATGGWTWLRMDQGGLVSLTNNAPGIEINGATMKVSEAGVDGMETFFAQTTYGGVTYKKGIELTDVQDPLYVEMGRSGSTVVRSGETVTYAPTVVSRSTQAVQTGWTFAFGLYDTDGNQVTGGSTTTTSSGSTTFSVDYATVKQYGGVSVRITATKS